MRMARQIARGACDCSERFYEEGRGEAYLARGLWGIDISRKKLTLSCHALLPASMRVMVSYDTVGGFRVYALYLAITSKKKSPSRPSHCVMMSYPPPALALIQSNPIRTSSPSSPPPHVPTPPSSAATSPVLENPDPQSFLLIQPKPSSLKKQRLSAMVKCPDCGAGADLTKDGSYAHCASCMY